MVGRGLVYVYNADAIEVFNAYEIYRLDVLEFVSPVAVGALLPLKANRFTRLTTTLNARERDIADRSMMKKRGVTECVLLNEYIKDCPKSRSSCSGLLKPHQTGTNNVCTFLDLPNEYVFADMDIAEAPDGPFRLAVTPGPLASLQ